MSYATNAEKIPKLPMEVTQNMALAAAPPIGDKVGQEHARRNSGSKGERWTRRKTGEPSFLLLDGYQAGLGQHTANAAEQEAEHADHEGPAPAQEGALRLAQGKRHHPHRQAPMPLGHVQPYSASLLFVSVLGPLGPVCCNADSRKAGGQDDGGR